jgi:hypothetical protein
VKDAASRARESEKTRRRRAGGNKGGVCRRSLSLSLSHPRAIPPLDLRPVLAPLAGMGAAGGKGLEALVKNVVVVVVGGGVVVVVFFCHLCEKEGERRAGERVVVEPKQVLWDVGTCWFGGVLLLFVFPFDGARQGPTHPETTKKTAAARTKTKKKAAKRETSEW